MCFFSLLSWVGSIVVFMAPGPEGAVFYLLRITGALFFLIMPCASYVYTLNSMALMTFRKKGLYLFLWICLNLFPIALNVVTILSSVMLGLNGDFV